VKENSPFSDGIVFLDHLCGPTAAYVASLDRDESDNYVLRSDCKDPDAFIVEPSLGELGSLLPVGSQWSQALEWRSFVGIPLIVQRRQWLAIGLEGVRRHARGGAFVTCRAFFLQWPLEKVMLEALQRLSQELCSRSQGNLICWTPRGISNIKAPSVNWLEHRHVEGHIIKWAVDDYAREKLTLFRTLILSEDEVWLDYRTWRSLSSFN